MFFAGRRDPSPSQLDAEGLGTVRCFRVPYLAPRAQVLLSIVRPRAEAAFARALRDYQPDVVLFHHLVRLSLRLPEVARRLDIPSVLVLHDNYLVCPSHSLVAFDAPVCPGGAPHRCARCLYAARFGGRVPPGVRHAAAWLLAWRSRLVPRQVRAVSRVVAPSRAVIEQIEARGVSLEGAVVIRHGSDRPAVRPPLDPKPGAVRFGYLGATLRKKGVGVLADACAGRLSRHLTIRGFPRSGSRRCLPARPSRAARPTWSSTRRAAPPSSRASTSRSCRRSASTPSRRRSSRRLRKGGRSSRAASAAFPEMIEPGLGGWLVPPGDVESLRAQMEQLLEDPREIRDVASRIPAWPSWSESTAEMLAVMEGAVNGRAEAGNRSRP